MIVLGSRWPDEALRKVLVEILAKFLHLLGPLEVQRALWRLRAGYELDWQVGLSTRRKLVSLYLTEDCLEVSVRPWDRRWRFRLWLHLDLDALVLPSGYETEHGERRRRCLHQHEANGAVLQCCLEKLRGCHELVSVDL